jgi:hypothetical protein
MTHASPLGPQSLVVRNAELPTTPVDGDLVILNLATNNYVGLDDIGSRIWTLIEAPVRVRDLTDALAAQFSGDAATIGDDVTGFLGELIDEGLVRVVAG